MVLGAAGSAARTITQVGNAASLLGARAGSCIPRRCEVSKPPLYQLQRRDPPMTDDRFPRLEQANKVRIDCPDGWLRVIYVAKFVEAALA